MTAGDKTSDLLSFTHSLIVVDYFDKKYYKVHLNEPNETWSKRLDDILDVIKEERIKHLPPNKYYYLRRSEYDDFVELVNKYDRRDANEESESEEETEHSTTEESSTDDELIQKTLARRLNSESKQYEDDKDHVSESDMEDVISLCRRFRSVYKLLTNMAIRIARLEDTIFRSDTKN